MQKLFSIAYEDRKSRRALEWAVDYLEIKKDIPFHRAFSDAYYTARVLAAIRDLEVLKNVSYDVFNPPLCREEEIKVQFDTYFKYISRTFPDKTAALADREVSSSKCYLCRRNLRKKGEMVLSQRTALLLCGLLRQAWFPEMQDPDPQDGGR